MVKTVVAVGSTRPAKLDAVSEALEAIGPMLDPETQFQVAGVEVPSGVGHTPQSRAELMAGARGRCQALRGMAALRGEPWRYFIGLEGGLDIVQEADHRIVFLENWAAVSDGTGRQTYGHSGGILVPDPLAAEVLERGTELSAAIDSYANGRGIRDAQGAVGVLSRNLVTRRDAYRLAVMLAFAPFFSATLYPGS
jgi:inosine/xanthosine triphosphatase